VAIRDQDGTAAAAAIIGAVPGEGLAANAGKAADATVDTLRTNVLGNIAKTKAGNAASNFGEYVQAERQITDAVALPGELTGRFDMVNNPGPLASLPGTPAANFSGGRYTSITLMQDITLYRGGDSSGSALGQWFTLEPPSSVAQVRIDSAVKPQWIDPKTGYLTGTSPVDTVYAVRVPAGTTIYQGPVGSQGGIYVGGSGKGQVQIFIPKTTPGLTPIGKTPIN